MLAAAFDLAVVGMGAFGISIGAPPAAAVRAGFLDGP